MVLKWIKDMQALEDQYGIKVDKRKAELPQPLKALGFANVPVKLHPEVTATVRVHIVQA